MRQKTKIWIFFASFSVLSRYIGHVLEYRYRSISATLSDNIKHDKLHSISTNYEENFENWKDLDRKISG